MSLVLSEELNKLAGAARALTSLLDNRHVGLMSWWSALHRALAEVHRCEHGLDMPVDVSQDVSQLDSEVAELRETDQEHIDDQTDKQSGASQGDGSD